MTNPFSITVDSPSPLDPGTLAFRSIVATEALGRCFDYRIEVTSTRSDLAANDLLGSSTTVELQTDGDPRYFHGLLAGIDYLGTVLDSSTYRFTVRPWLWFLSRNSNCRIFQNMTVPDILSKVFHDQGFADFDPSGLTADNYKPQPYTVQYRESDFNFVMRLMEREGIYYFFKHEEKKHTLVLVDSYITHTPPGGADSYSLPYHQPDAHRDALIEYVGEWTYANSVEAGKYSLADFDFTKSRARLFTSSDNEPGYVHDDQEVYDYPGGFVERSVGEEYALVRLQERQQPLEHAAGVSNALELAVGYLFTLADHPRDDQNGDYLITAATHRGRGAELESSSDDQEVMKTTFSAIDATSQFRPAPSALRPTVRGPHTAIVVGPKGEEIWCDKYGRVKVQFHWDREGQNDENSSCWIRVAQIWAGANWGGIHIPRIGQEVIVDFLEGDPDRPIITGRVYNDANMPPYALPAKQTQSGIKSRSSKKGGLPNANEIRFEDLKGSEEFFVQAEKDLDTVVKNNETRSVGVDRTVKIGNDDSLSVGKDRGAKVHSNDSIQVGGDRSVKITGNEATSIAGNQSLMVSGGRTESVGGNDTVLVGATHSLTAAAQAVIVGSRTKAVAGDESAKIGGDLSVSVGGDQSVTVSGDRSGSIGGDDKVDISGAQNVNVGDAGSLTVSKQLVIDAGDEIVIKAGDASITLKKNGDIVLKGNNLTSDASGNINVKAASNVTLKGSKISQN